MSGDRHDPGRWQKRLDDPGLTRRILDRTSGRACGRAEALLGARWDAAPSPIDFELLAGHLHDCAACRELDTVLERLQALLPGLAEREPGPTFTARVLARTSGLRPAPRPAAPGARARLASRLRDGARRAWNRPRFALEAAWTAAALVALLVWSPVAPPAAADQATGLVRAGAAAMPEVLGQVERLVEAAVIAGREILGPRVENIEERTAELGDDLARRVETVTREGRRLWERLTAEDPQPESE
jgi:hypothetical protein